jgi:hypothetical protein
MDTLNVRLLLEPERDLIEFGEDGSHMSPAETLSLRLTEQEHWQQAESVRDGRQPLIDPDGPDLEEIDHGVRQYCLHDVEGEMDGLPAVITQRLVKRMMAGIWTTEIVIDSYRRADGPPIAL